MSTRATDTPSTRHLTADLTTCRILARALGVSIDTTFDAFYGEPFRMVEAITDWSLNRKEMLAIEMGSAYADIHWNHAEAILGWAREKGRGVWNPSRYRVSA